ncbi:hypothetical protein Dform_01389 [Dehalogenimonas formicexedens]|uniref:Inner membrane protein YgaP-like transmembrane domain-containing protein n=1 Tax=Dehalogenimonas formicexedens TaxID=1839801 RepID=A0A1P8F8F8_9CHLR|nr:DUF2892 domain-containing protein [Dehalogenimonas formicexedens]APV44713.1 hypothetical protein Dform_01389 [Dehalogenimonas formicexedens]
MKLKQNLGPVDGLIRALLGVGLFLLANLTVEGIRDGVLEVAAVILIFTAVLGYCPIYALLGFTTRKPERD